jgi:hypothetical protein
MTPEPIAVYTPPAFLEAEYTRIAGSWFWKTYLRHLDNQMMQHMEICMASAGGPAENLRVAAAMASAFRTALTLPDLIRGGQVLFAGQIIGQAPRQGRQSATDGEDDHGDDQAG